MDGGSKLKVKKFKIKPRIPSVKKNLKGIMGTNKLQDNIDEILATEAESYTTKIIPHAFYQTWQIDDIPASLQKLLVDNDVQKAISASILIGTVGSVPEELLSECLMEGETNRTHFLTALSEEAAGLSLQFLTKLLVEDAKQDDCTVSDPIFITEPQLLSETLQLVKAEEEGISMDQGDHLSPRFTRVALVAWLPIKKKNKTGSLSRKRTA